MRLEDVDRDGAPIRIDFHTHDDGVPRRMLDTVERRIDPIHIDELQCEVEFVARIGAAHQPHQKLPVARQATDQRFAHVAQRLPAGDIAHRLPAHERRFDGIVRELVGLAWCVLGARLHDEPRRAYHVRFDHSAELARVVVVVAQLAPSRTKAVEVTAKLFVDARIGGDPVGRHAVDARGLKAANLLLLRDGLSAEDAAKECGRLHAPNLTMMRPDTPRGPLLPSSAATSR
ncbi:hypothetical protein D3C71_1357970 [compost metagenome]